MCVWWKQGLGAAAPFWPADIGLVVNPIRPGQPDCAFFMKTGVCKFGETCKFNHPPPGSARGPGPSGRPQPVIGAALGGEPPVGARTPTHAHALTPRSLITRRY